MGNLSDTQAALAQLRQDKMVRAFRVRAAGDALAPPTAEQWQRLTELFAESLPQAYAIIGQEGLLIQQELLTAIITLLDFTNAEVATLLETTPQRVTNIKAAANGKLFGEASATTLKSNLIAQMNENVQKV